MSTPPDPPPGPRNVPMTITVTEDGPYIVRGSVPLTSEEIVYDDDGDCRAYRQTKTHPLREQYALCRCGQSRNKPFCDGRHLR